MPFLIMYRKSGYAMKQHLNCKNWIRLKKEMGILHLQLLSKLIWAMNMSRAYLVQIAVTRLHRPTKKSIAVVVYIICCLSVNGQRDTVMTQTAEFEGVLKLFLRDANKLSSEPVIREQIS